MFRNNYYLYEGFEQHEPKFGALHAEFISDEDSAFVKQVNVYQYQNDREVIYYHRISGDPKYVYKFKLIKIFEGPSAKSEYLKWKKNDSHY